MSGGFEGHSEPPTVSADIPTTSPRSALAPQSAGRPKRPIGSAAAVVAVVLVSLNLRPGATSVGPVLDEIRGGLGMGPAVAGLITALPGLCFGVVGAVAMRLSRAAGLTRAILLGLVCILTGLSLRAFVDSTWAFLAFSVLGLAGMAVGNVLAPVWIKVHSRDGDRRQMTIYSMGLTLGGALGSLCAAPLLQNTAGGWRSAIGFWALLALVAVIPWAMLALRDGPGTPRSPSRAVPRARLIHSRTAVALCIFFGVEAMNAYVQFGWVPQIYRDAGLSAVAAGALVAMLTSLAVVGGLLMPLLVLRSADLTWMMLTLGAFMAAGYVGLWLAPTIFPWLWSLLLGVSGWTFPAAIVMLTARTRDPAITGRLSGFVQSVGYLLAAAGPLLVGVIHGATHDWSLVLALLASSAAVMTFAGLILAKPTCVDDEMAAV